MKEGREREHTEKNESQAVSQTKFPATSFSYTSITTNAKRPCNMIGARSLHKGRGKNLASELLKPAWVILQW